MCRSGWIGEGGVGGAGWRWRGDEEQGGSQVVGIRCEQTVGALINVYSWLQRLMMVQKQDCNYRERKERTCTSGQYIHGRRNCTR